ncbi:MAG: class III extradiol ring-cleavage dioxygenase, partial [Myxococcales bacterium]|nr:dioxygenase [Polyangiaceae bacterium]MDW8248863.1 class III extradiol ring-cleavage dioxygenase [Myxococcales bacterium]
EDPQRGFDHGTFVPLKLTYPEAEIPTLQLSLRHGLDPAEHLAMGQALAPLRDEGVFLIGSGMSYHNMQGFFHHDPKFREESRHFDLWLNETIALPAKDRNLRLSRWTDAPAARQSHPREEHLLPLMVVAGAAGDDLGRTVYQGLLMGVHVSGHRFG